MKNNLTNRLVKTALVTAIYAIVTIILAPISYRIFNLGYQKFLFY